MTIASQTSRISYNGDGSTTAFPVPFYFLTNSDLVVYLEDTNGNLTIQSLGTNYSLSGAGLSSGGTCTFVTAPAAGESVTVYRDPPVTQTTSYNNNDPFPAKSHENALDKLTTLIQRTRDIAGRSLHFPDGDPTPNSAAILGSAAARANKLFGFDTNGQPIYVLGPTFVADTVVGVATIDTRATAQVTGFLATTTTISVNGYATVGDAPTAIYKRVATQPSHQAKFRSTDQFLPNGTVDSVNGGWWELQNSVVTPEMLGHFGIGTSADTLKFQDAVELGRPINLLPKLYIWALSQTVQVEGNGTGTVSAPINCCVRARTGMKIIGVPGSSVIQLADSQSTDSAPLYFSMIVGNEVIEDTLLYGIEFDINGANNKISPLRGSGTYNYFNAAAFHISGSSGSVGVDARLNRAKFLFCDFLNTPGVNFLILQQTNKNSDGSGSGATLGYDTEVGFCRFINGGLDANDHSSIYGWSDLVRVHHCLFDFPDAVSTGTQGPLAAMEMHGSDIWFTDNMVRNYCWGLYNAHNYTSVASGQYVTGNTFIVANTAVRSANDVLTSPGMADLFVQNNNIILLPGNTGATNLNSSRDYKVAIDMTAGGGLDGATVTGNRIWCLDTVAAWAISVGGGAVDHATQKVKVSNNTCKGFATNIALGLVAGTVANVTVSDNDLLDITPNTAVPTGTLGVFLTGTIIGTVKITGNTTGSSVSGHPEWDIILDTSTLTNLIMDGNSENGSSGIFDGSVVSGKRIGLQALSFPNATALDTQWPSAPNGSFGWNSAAPTELTSSAGKYTLSGWRRVAGSWLERHELTGN